MVSGFGPFFRDGTLLVTVSVSICILSLRNFHLVAPLIRLHGRTRVYVLELGFLLQLLCKPHELPGSAIAGSRAFRRRYYAREEEIHFHGRRSVSDLNYEK